MSAIMNRQGVFAPHSHDCPMSFRRLGTEVVHEICTNQVVVTLQATDVRTL